MQGTFNVINFELQNISSLRNVMNAVEDLRIHMPLVSKDRAYLFRLHYITPLISPQKRIVAEKRSTPPTTDDRKNNLKTTSFQSTNNCDVP